MTIHIVLLGPPGAGKGTQAARITQRYDIPHLSTGDILRSAIRSGSELGKQVQDYVTRGELAPVALVVDCIRERVSCDDARRGFVLDGFPRTIAQAETLDGLMRGCDMVLGAAIELATDDASLLCRIIGRAREAAAAGQAVRADDTEESLKVRLAAFHKQTAPLRGYYEQAGIFRSVDGLADVE
ncbi:MAG: adenylate kinase, partial [Nevskia sp.]|nr:adenylate kinase [Nevskia sp.]